MRKGNVAKEQKKNAVADSLLRRGYLRGRRDRLVGWDSTRAKDGPFARQGVEVRRAEDHRSAEQKLRTSAHIAPHARQLRHAVSLAWPDATKSKMSIERMHAVTIEMPA